MIKNKITYFIVLLIIGIFLGLSGSSYASSGECSEEKIKQINNDIDNEIKKHYALLNKQIAVTKAYVNQYIQNCETGSYTVPGETNSHFSSAQQLALTKLGLSTKLNLVYAGMRLPDSTTARSGRSADCAALKKAANDASQLTKVYWADLVHRLDLKNGNISTRTCVCSEENRENNLKAAASQNNEDAACMAVLNDLEAQEVDKKCKNVAEYQQEYMGNGSNDCLLCGIFRVILETGSRIADKAWNAVAEPLSNVVMSFFLVIIALETLKIVSNMAGSSISSYLKTLLTNGLKVAITYYALNHSAVIYNYFISPVLQAGMDIATEMMSLSSEGVTALKTGQSAGLFAGTTLSPKLLATIYDTVVNYNTTAAFLPAVGNSLMCYAWAERYPIIDIWLSGLFYYLAGIFVWLVITFYIIDCTVQLGMVCAFVPIFIACWPFKLTSRYSVKGVRMIMNTFFDFAMLGVVLLIGTKITGFAMTAGKPGEGIEKLLDLLNNFEDNIEQIREMMQLSGKQVIILFCCGYISLKIIGKTSGLSKMFSDSSGAGMGAALGGLATSAVAKPAVGLAKFSGKVAWKGTKSLASKTGNTLKNSKVGQVAISMKNNWVQGARKRFSKLVGKPMVSGSGLANQSRASTAQRNPNFDFSQMFNNSGNNNRRSGGRNEGESSEPNEEIITDESDTE